MSMSNDIEFKPAVRTNTAIILALCGGSGSGKTKSALELAVGLAAGGDILVIDSEGARALHYADEYKFLHYDWRAPYTPESLGTLLRAANERKVAVTIVDSMSSEHEDEGGLVDMAEVEYQKQPQDSKNSAAAWAKPKASHKHHIVRWLRRARCHVIFCCRASEKVKFERVEQGGRKRTVIVPIGWTPVAEKNLLYDVTTSLLFTPDQPGVPQPIKLYDKHRPFFPAGKPITRENGAALAAWAAGGAPAIEHSESAYLAAAYQEADKGTQAFRDWWKEQPRHQRDLLRANLDELQAKAEESDRAEEDPFGLPPLPEEPDPLAFPPVPPAEVAGEDEVPPAPPSPAATPHSGPVIVPRRKEDGTTNWHGTFDDMVLDIRAGDTVARVEAFVKRYKSLIDAMPEPLRSRLTDVELEHVQKLRGAE